MGCAEGKMRRATILGMITTALLLGCTPYSPWRLHEATADQLKLLNTADLCDALHDDALPNVVQELKRRGALTSQDGKLLVAHQEEISIGLSECALRMMWGSPLQINHTVVAGGDHAQYVFGPCDWGDCVSNRFADVENGRVTAFQD
jgi:hypothetical protein